MDLDQLARAFKAFASHEPTHLYLHAAQVFIEVARSKRCTYEEIANALGITTSSVSRVVNSMSAMNRHGEPGLGLLETMKDPDEGRRYLVVLTPKGRALMLQLKSL